MKYFSLLLLASYTLVAQATDLKEFFKSEDAQQICEQAIVFSPQSKRDLLKFVKQDGDKIYFVMSSGPATNIIVFDLTSNSKVTIKSNESIIDIQFYQDEVFYIGKTRIERRDRATQYLKEEFRSLPGQYQYRKYTYASGATIVGDTLYMIHGELGVFPYDLQQRVFGKAFFPSVPQPQEGHRSMITGIASVGSVLYLAYDDITLAPRSKAFEGLVIFDLISHQAKKVIPVQQTREAYAKPSLTVDGDFLYVSNWFLNFKHELKQLMKAKYMKPQLRLWKYPSGELVGKALIFEDHLYGCFYDRNSNILNADFVNIK